MLMTIFLLHYTFLPSFGFSFSPLPLPLSSLPLPRDLPLPPGGFDPGFAEGEGFLGVAGFLLSFFLPVPNALEAPYQKII